MEPVWGKKKSTHLEDMLRILENGIVLGLNNSISVSRVSRGLMIIYIYEEYLVK